MSSDAPAAKDHDDKIEIVIGQIVDFLNCHKVKNIEIHQFGFLMMYLPFYVAFQKIKQSSHDNLTIIYNQAYNSDEKILDTLGELDGAFKTPEEDGKESSLHIGLCQFRGLPLETPENIKEANQNAASPSLHPKTKREGVDISKENPEKIKEANFFHLPFINFPPLYGVINSGESTTSRLLELSCPPQDLATIRREFNHFSTYNEGSTTYDAVKKLVQTGSTIINYPPNEEFAGLKDGKANLAFTVHPWKIDKDDLGTFRVNFKSISSFNTKDATSVILNVEKGGYRYLSIHFLMLINNLLAATITKLYIESGDEFISKILTDNICPLGCSHKFISPGSHSTECYTCQKPERDCLKGARYVIDSQVYKHLRELTINYGPILNKFKNSKQVDNLLNNMSDWKSASPSIWFGDKCYHMVNHSYEHISNEWDMFCNLLRIIMGNKKGIKESFDFKTDNDTDPNNDTNPNLYLYSLCMAVWLHDIGHSGNERYGAAHEIRDNHGIISGEFTLKHPNLINLYDGDGYGEPSKNDWKLFERDNWRIYEKIKFPLGERKITVLEFIKSNIESNKKVGIAELTALFCIFHKSNSPINNVEYASIVKKGKEKTIPLDFYESSDRRNKVITLESIISGLGDDDNQKPAIFKMLALFRFVDAIDIRKNRVGDSLHEKLKKEIIRQDKEYAFTKMKAEMLTIVNHKNRQADSGSIDTLAMMQIFYQDVIARIDKGESVSHLELPFLTPSMSTDLYDYFNLANYASFLSVQEGHFDFHKSVDRVKIEPCNDGVNAGVEIIFEVNKKLVDLTKPIVRDPGDKDMQSFIERLLGPKPKIGDPVEYEKGYIVKEYLSGGKDLMGILKLKKVSIMTEDSEDSKDVNIKVSVAKVEPNGWDLKIETSEKNQNPPTWTPITNKNDIMRYINRLYPQRNGNS